MPGVEVHVALDGEPKRIYEQAVEVCGALHALGVLPCDVGRGGADAEYSERMTDARLGGLAAEALAETESPVPLDELRRALGL